MRARLAVGLLVYGAVVAAITMQLTSIYLSDETLNPVHLRQAGVGSSDALKASTQELDSLKRQLATMTESNNQLREEKTRVVREARAATEAAAAAAAAAAEAAAIGTGETHKPDVCAGAVPLANEVPSHAARYMLSSLRDHDYGHMRVDECRARSSLFATMSSWKEHGARKNDTKLTIRPDNVCILHVDHRDLFEFGAKGIPRNRSRLVDAEDGEHVPYFTQVFWLNYLWASRNGFRFHIYHDNKWEWDYRNMGRPHRTVHWRKIPGIQQMLTDEPLCEYVLYLDSDVYLRGRAHDILKLIEEQLGSGANRDTGEPVVMVTRDQTGEKVAANTGSLNTGVVVVRRHPIANRLLNRWYFAPMTNRTLEMHSNKWPYDQGTFNVVVADEFAANIRIVPLLTMNSPQGHLARHLWGGMSNAQATLWMRHAKLGNVIKGILAELLHPCVVSRMVVPNETTSIDMMHGVWPKPFVQ